MPIIAHFAQWCKEKLQMIPVARNVPAPYALARVTRKKIVAVIPCMTVQLLTIGGNFYVIYCGNSYYPSNHCGCVLVPIYTDLRKDGSIYMKKAKYPKKNAIVDRCVGSLFNTGICIPVSAYFQ